MSNLPDLILRSKNHILKLSTELNKKLRYGYDCGGDEKSIDKLKDYIDIYQKEWYKRKSQVVNRDCDGKVISIKGYKLCLDKEQYKCLQEKIIEIIGHHCRVKCTDLIVNRNNESDWILNNPLCVSYEAWNKYAKIKIRELKIDLELEQQAENFLIELSLETITPEVVVALQTIETVNKLGLTLEYSEETSKIEFELLLEKHPEAKIDLDTYIELKQNNISFDIISEIYSNNLELEVHNSLASLKTPMEIYAPFTLDLEEFGNQMEISVDMKKYISDYKNK